METHSPEHLRGVNALQFQIASHSSTAISTFQPAPPPAVPLWTLEFQPRGPCGSPGAGWRPWPPLDPRPSGHMLGLGRPYFVLGCMHPKCIQHHFQWRHRRLLLISAHPQKNVSLRRSCGACLRRPCGAGVRPLKYPEVPRARLRRAPPDPAVPCPLPPLWPAGGSKRTPASGFRPHSPAPTGGIELTN